MQKLKPQLCNLFDRIPSNTQNRKQQEHRMDNTKSKIIKLALVCLICVSLVTGLVYLIQFLIS